MPRSIRHLVTLLNMSSSELSKLMNIGHLDWLSRACVHCVRVMCT